MLGNLYNIVVNHISSITFTYRALKSFNYYNLVAYDRLKLIQFHRIGTIVCTLLGY